MREIKFRVWDKDNKRMRSLTEAINLDKINFSYNEIIQDNMILIQCTGLRDKYGKEIYEDDIIKTEGFFIQKLNRISVVKWSETGGYWMA